MNFQILPIVKKTDTNCPNNIEDIEIFYKRKYYIYIVIINFI